MSGYQLEVATLAAGFGLAAFLFFLFLFTGRLRSSRKTAVSTAAAALLISLAFLAIVVTISEEPTLYRIRYLPEIITGVPVDATLAYIARKQVQAMYGTTEHPRIRFLLFYAPYILAMDWITTLAFGVLSLKNRATLPSISQHKPPGSVLHIFLLNIPELPYMVLIGVVFLLAAGPTNPSSQLRKRNLALSLAMFCLAVICCVEIAGAFNDAFSPQRAIVPVDVSLTAFEIILLISSALFWLYGLATHLHRTEVDEWVYRIRQWSEVRELIGIARLRTPLLADYPLQSGSHFLSMAAKTLALTEQDAAKAKCTLQIVYLLNVPQDRLQRYGIKVDRQNILKCASLYDVLLSRQSVPERLDWVLEDKDENHMAYELAEDPLRYATRPALRLTGGERNVNLNNEPLWLQLAAMTAADIEILADGKRKNILAGANVNRTVLQEYNAAKKAMISTTSLGR